MKNWPQDLNTSRRVYGNFRKDKYDAINAPKRWKKARDGRPGMSEDHLAAIRKLPCLVCGTHKAIHAHHLRSGKIAQLRGVGLKAPDRFSVSLCWLHHSEVHSIGSRKERDWLIEHSGIDAYNLADALWAASPDEHKMYRIVLAHQLQASRDALK